MGRNLSLLEQIRFVPAAEIPCSRLEKFYHVAFPSRAYRLFDSWRWQYQGCNETNTGEWPLVAIDHSGTVVGHASSIPITLELSGKKIKAAWFVDYFVLPEFRHTGIGGYLIQQVMGAAPVMLAIAVSKHSWPVFKKFGWREQKGTKKFTTPLRPSDFSVVSRLGMSKSASLFDSFLRRCVAMRCWGNSVVGSCQKPNTKQLVEIFSGYYGPYESDETAIVVRDEKYFRWRIYGNQMGGKFSLHRVAETYALCRTVFSSGLYELNILMIVGDQLESMFCYLYSIAVREKLSRISLVTSNKKVQDVARKWFVFASNLPPFYFSEDHKHLERLAQMRVNWEMIDSDLDLVSVGSA